MPVRTKQCQFTALPDVPTVSNDVFEGKLPLLFLAVTCGHVSLSAALFLFFSRWIAYSLWLFLEPPE
jgi:hypothetical protein